MKKILTSLSVIALAGLLFVGCSTTNSINNNAAEQALITTAAATGTEITLQQDPQYTLYFVGAEQALASIASGTNEVSVTTVESALDKAGVTNAIIATAIENAITLGDDFIKQSAGTNASAQFVAAQQVAGDVATGIQQGLALSGKATLKKK